MKRNERYYGQVWFDTDEQDKKFAVLVFENDKILIETNLHSPQFAYKAPHILGTFNGLGFTTFIDCQIKLSSSGIINSLVYNPTYCFVGVSHFVNPYELTINEFYIVNEAIVKWIDHRPFWIFR